MRLIDRTDFVRVPSIYFLRFELKIHFNNNFHFYLIIATWKLSLEQGSVILEHKRYIVPGGGMGKDLVPKCPTMAA